ncbi:MAG TPA: hypothetical protein VL769_04005 [Acidimicrobiia bacterium]|nr:hypothetical protein [Acidimicrobiia bacterium]
MVDPTVIAVDWSGAKETGPRSGIWLAVVQNGELVRTEALASRARAVAFVQACPSPVIAGFDFSFGVPAWFARKHGCTTITDVWSLAERDGETWLASPPMPPFWREHCEVPVEQRLRRCEERLRPAKSIFQLVGNGQVGAGSVRGMPHLARLRGAGFAVWPFDHAIDRTAMEIYPSLMRKLAAHHDVGPFATEHERDAVVSARVMWDHREAIAALGAATDPTTLIEGDVWLPSPSL